MIRIKMRPVVSAAATIIGISALVYLMAGYESALNSGIAEFTIPLLLWRMMLYAVAGAFWLYRIRPHLRQRCPERRIRRTECLMLSLVILGELTGVMRGL